MTKRVVLAGLLALSAPLASAAPPPQAGATPTDPAAAHAQLETLRGQVKRQDTEVTPLKSKVPTLEPASQAAQRELEERDRKIAELRRQLEAQQGH
jgi:septal ring factor EnvC (AmiA/AmiB activator)